jgi:hypothetical protein
MQEADDSWVVLDPKEKATVPVQSTYGGYGLSLGYGHMMTEVENNNIVVRYYEIEKVDVAFSIKMFV